MLRLISLVRTNPCISLAANVTVYNSLDFNASAPMTAKPRAVSQILWKFVYHSEHNFFMYITIKNKSPSVTSLDVTNSINHGTLDAERSFATTVCKNDYMSGYVNSTEIAKLNLYKSEDFCSSLLVTEGRDGPRNEELLYDRICTHDCVLEVDFSNEFECVDAITTVIIISSTLGTVLVTDDTATNSNKSYPESYDFCRSIGIRCPKHSSGLSWKKLSDPFSLIMFSDVNVIKRS